jgi:hypothetical protein
MYQIENFHFYDKQKLNPDDQVLTWVADVGYQFMLYKKMNTQLIIGWFSPK